SRTLTLTGTSTGANTMTSVIADPSSGSTSLLKSGAGTWVLAGANTYTGNTTIANGTLKLAGGNDRLPTSTSVTLGDGGNNSGILELCDGGRARNQRRTRLVADDRDAPPTTLCPCPVQAGSQPGRVLVQAMGVSDM